MGDVGRCDQKVYEKGEVVCIVHSIPSEDIEKWVRKLAEKTKQRMDWHFVGGRGVVKTLGNLDKARKAADEMKDEVNALGKKIWDKQLGSAISDDYAYVSVTHDETQEERDEKEKMQQRWTDHAAKHFALTEYLVEANSNEHLILWQQYHEAVVWKEVGMGSLRTVGTIKVDGNDMPVCVSVRWDFLDGHCICFYEATSMVVHHEWIEKDLMKAIDEAVKICGGEEKYKGKCDAMNFHNCVHSLNMRVNRDKLKL